MDVKYIPSDWEKMKKGIDNIISHSLFGDGMLHELKKLNDVLEDAESAIARHDVDDSISFQHTSQKSKYEGLQEDFEVLQRFSGKVGDIVDRTIDTPFYKDMDAFVTAIEDLNPVKYTTRNRIGATETQQVYDGYGPAQTFEVSKKEVNLDDLLNGDSFYGKQMKLEYEEWKNLDPDQDFTEEDYRQAIIHMRAFEYESIRDKQENIEFWTQIGLAVVAIGAFLIFPPAGIALAAVSGTLELTSAVTGKDVISKRELDTSERWVRGVLSPIDIVPGVGAVGKFSRTAVTRVGSRFADMGQLGIRTAESKISAGAHQVQRLVDSASNYATIRVRHATLALKDAKNAAINKVTRDVVDVRKAIDSSVTWSKNNLNLGRLTVTPEGFLMPTKKVYENTHKMENGLTDFLSKFEGINLKPRGAGKNSKIIEITAENFGKHIIKGRNGRKELAPNVRYITEENYKYTTDELGRIVDVNAEELILGKGKRNTAMQVAVGREDRLFDDDGGHLIGTQFRGSGDIDNLLAQNKYINRSGGEWYKMETEWANALKEIPPKKVSVKIKPVFVGNSLRPDSYKVIYEIEGKGIFKKTIENRAGG